MAGNGGKREGAGRPKGSKGGHTLLAEQARARLIERVHSELDPILTAQIDAAQGLYYEDVTPDGKKRIYKQKPDVNAAKYLLDQTAGKARENLDVTSGGQPLPIYAGASVQGYKRNTKDIPAK